jgi:trans-2,3-dihydro-3-hydroxyanthranilate isomerase
MGRPSEIALSIDVSGGKITAVRIGGAAVRISSGTLQPPLPE